MSNAQIDNAVAAIMASRPTFKVGDRVRVTGAIGECRQDWAPSGTRLGHDDMHAGLTGWISRIDSADDRNHPICVEMDRSDLLFVALYMSPSELELLPPVPPAHDGGEGEA